MKSNVDAFCNWTVHTLYYARRAALKPDGDEQCDELMQSAILEAMAIIDRVHGNRPSWAPMGEDEIVLMVIAILDRAREIVQGARQGESDAQTPKQNG